MKRTSTKMTVLTATWLGVALAACAPPRVDFSEAMRQYEAGDYTKVQERWTRKAQIFDGLSSIAFMAATLKTWDWRQAYLARSANTYALTTAEQTELTAAQRALQGRYHEVFLSVSMTPRRWNDLDKPRSRWKIALVNDAGEELMPARIERMKIRTPEMATFFPFHDAFSEAYLLRFDKVLPGGKPLISPETRKVTLRLAGAPGRAEAHWQAKK